MIKFIIHKDVKQEIVSFKKILITQKKVIFPITHVLSSTKYVLMIEQIEL